MQLERNPSRKPLTDLQSNQIQIKWSRAKSSVLDGREFSYFSGVCYIYGYLLQSKLEIPIGLVATSYGGTRIQSWSSTDVLKTCNKHNSQDSSLYDDDLNFLYFFLSLFSFFSFCYYLFIFMNRYYGMIHPLMSYTIKGVIWYQGEANINEPGDIIHQKGYACLFPKMIKDYRKKWYEISETTDINFPFGFVQLSGYGDGVDNLNIGSLRLSQTAYYGYTPNPLQNNVFMAMAIDLSDPNAPLGAVHPRPKFDVGLRLYFGALYFVYKNDNKVKNNDIYYTGPLFKSCEINKNEIILYFNTTVNNNKEDKLELKDKYGFEITNGAVYI